VLPLNQNSFQRRMQLIFRTKDLKLKKEVLSFIDEWNADSNSIKTKTSGSTGLAKHILIEKKYMIASAKMTGDFLQLRKDSNALLCLSPRTIGGKMMIVRAIVLELNLIISDLSSTPLEGIKEDIHFAAMVPLQLASELTRSDGKVKKIEQLIIGGGPVTRELASKTLNFSNEVYQTFGMTETISHVAMRKLSAGEEKYTALPEVKFSQKDKCLIIHAPSLGIDSLPTNDLVELMDSKTFKWIGRSDFIINSGGIKHSPEEIELKLSTLFTCDYFITGLPDNTLGERIVLCVESPPKDLERDDFKTVLSKYQVPKEIYYFSKFKRTESGKIDRKTTLKYISNVQKQVL